ncbi:MAG: OmpA family protein [Prevotella sp.]|nr:OmpA family protein [Prevotella sp.]
MKMRNLIAAIMLLVSGTAMAQATYTDAEGNEYEFKKHAFITLGGGMQYTLGEAKFGDLLSPNAQLGIGYQFSPVLAARLQANAWQAKGGWNGLGNPPLNRDYKFNYAAPGIDLMFNLSNLICGYNPNRVFNVTAFLGGGLNCAWGNDEANDIANELGARKGAYNLEYIWDGSKMLPFGRGGLELAFRLGDKVNLLVEGNANLTSDKWNSKKAGNADWYFNGLVGLRFNLGSTYEKKEAVKVVEKPQTPPQTKPATPVKPVVTEPVKPTPKPDKVEPLRRDIFFVINKFEIRESEESKVADIAKYLQNNPNAKVALCGYADRGTGNDRINDRLGEQRVNVVKDMLVKKYNIPESRITTDSKGAREQPFAVNEQNRVTIAIAE